jgi:ATP-dependent Clp protease ATP-binding subunit ClpA
VQHAQTAHPDRSDVAVGTEHLLLALAMDPGSRARRVLADLGTDIAQVKNELACYVSAQPHRAGSAGAATHATSCAFCGTPETETRPLVHGPNVAIRGTCAQRDLENLTARSSH